MSKQLKKIFFVLGGPGSGKGTFCENFVKRNSFANHYSAGQLLRDFMQKNQKTKDPNNKKIYNIVMKSINQGKIVPAQVTTQLIQENIEQDESNFLMIDGFPRNQDNYKYWEKNNKQSTENYTIFLNCNEETLLKRMINRQNNSIQKRSDDTEDIFKLRLQTFQTETMPIIDKYRLKNKLIELNAEQNPMQIVEDFEKIYPKFVA